MAVKSLSHIGVVRTFIRHCSNSITYTREGAKRTVTGISGDQMVKLTFEPDESLRYIMASSVLMRKTGRADAFTPINQDPNREAVFHEAVFIDANDLDVRDVNKTADQLRIPPKYDKKYYYFTYVLQIGQLLRIFDDSSSAHKPLLYFAHATESFDSVLCHFNRLSGEEVIMNKFKKDEQSYFHSVRIYYGEALDAIRIFARKVGALSQQDGSVNPEEMRKRALGIESMWRMTNTLYQDLFRAETNGHIPRSGQTLSMYSDTIKAIASAYESIKSSPKKDI
jgi:hypothetical protein